MKYTVEELDKLFSENLEKAQQQLSSLPVAEGRRPNLRGLNGWVYEQTIRYSLSSELAQLGLSPVIKEQVALEGRIKIDLCIGRIALEIKLAGSFGDDDEKYSVYRAKAEEKGLIYCYVTRGESHAPYRLRTISIFGEQRAFFLDKKGDWQRLVETIARRA
jgi:hypothetical protein